MYNLQKNYKYKLQFTPPLADEVVICIFFVHCDLLIVYCGKLDLTIT